MKITCHSSFHTSKVNFNELYVDWLIFNLRNGLWIMNIQLSKVVSQVNDRKKALRLKIKLDDWLVL